MLVNTVDIALPLQRVLLQLALPMTCRDGVIQQLCADASAVSLVCLSVCLSVELLDSNTPRHSLSNRYCGLLLTHIDVSFPYVAM